MRGKCRMRIEVYSKVKSGVENGGWYSYMRSHLSQELSE
jgi:hypothetical protein